MPDNTTHVSGRNLLLYILAVFFPPLPVWIKRGFLSADSLINIALCMLGALPGILHSFYIIYTNPDAYVYEYTDIETGVRYTDGTSQDAEYETLRSETGTPGPTPGPSGGSNGTAGGPPGIVVEEPTGNSGISGVQAGGASSSREGSQGLIAPGAGDVYGSVNEAESSDPPPYESSGGYPSDVKIGDNKIQR